MLTSGKVLLALQEQKDGIVEEWVGSAAASSRVMFSMGHFVASCFAKHGNIEEGEPALHK